LGNSPEYDYQKLLTPSKQIEKENLMARSLSVKIPTASLIADIEASIAKIEAEVAEYPAKMEEYRKAKAEYNDNLLKAVIKAIQDPKNIGTEYDSVVRVNHSRYGGGVEVSVRSDLLNISEAPTEPTKPNERQSFGRDYTTRKALLEKNLKVLKMTSQEEVSATTYNTVIDLL
jgi:hypothetical protein